MSDLFSGNGTIKKYREFAELLLTTPIGIDKSSAQGWAYILEMTGLITKADFDRAESWTGKAVKDGFLPIDFVASEEAREAENLSVPCGVSPVQNFGSWLDAAERSAWEYHCDWWRGEDVYVEMVVEKIDLLTIFQPICAEFHIPISNAGGWSSRLHRGTFAQRFKQAEGRGQQCILLYCGDHDPDGLRIADTLRDNIDALKNVAWTNGETGYDPADLTIHRFGLTEEFIEENGFPWIENLITGSGKNLADPNHKNHDLPYVQEYLATIGERKCEANVLVTNPDAGRELCRNAIEQFLGPDAKTRFEKKRTKVVKYFDRWKKRTGVDEHIGAIRDSIDQEPEVMGLCKYE